MNPGGCGGVGKDAGPCEEKTKRKEKKGKDFVQGSGGQGTQKDTKVVGPTGERRRRRRREGHDLFSNVFSNLWVATPDGKRS